MIMMVTVALWVPWQFYWCFEEVRTSLTRGACPSCRSSEQLRSRMKLSNESRIGRQNLSSMHWKNSIGYSSFQFSGYFKFCPREQNDFGELSQNIRLIEFPYNSWHQIIWLTKRNVRFWDRQIPMEINIQNLCTRILHAKHLRFTAHRTKNSFHIRNLIHHLLKVQWVMKYQA